MVDGWVGWALVEFQGFQVFMFFRFDLAGSNEACSTTAAAVHRYGYRSKL
jgi:hypothetical protein